MRSEKREVSSGLEERYGYEERNDEKQKERESRDTGRGMKKDVVTTGLRE